MPFSQRIGFLGKGNSSQPQGLIEQIAAGAMGFKAARRLGNNSGDN